MNGVLCLSLQLKYIAFGVYLNSYIIGEFTHAHGHFRSSSYISKYTFDYITPELIHPSWGSWTQRALTRMV